MGVGVEGQRVAHAQERGEASVLGDQAHARFASHQRVVPGRAWQQARQGQGAQSCERPSARG